MTPDGLHIDPASLRELKVSSRRFKVEVLRSAHDGLKAFGMQIVARAKQMLRDNGNIATGLLRNSGRTVEKADGTIDAGFYAAYAAAVEYGRKAGGMPPVDVDGILQWVRRKRIMPKDVKGRDLDQQQRSLAWAIALSIKEKGTKAHPFLKPAYEEFRGRITRFMQRHVDNAVAKFKAK